MSTEAQEIAIKRWLETVAVLGPQFVFQSNGNGERPNGEYITFRFLTGNTSDYPGKKTTKVGDPATEVNEEWFLRETLIYQIDIYAKEGKHIANKLWASRSDWRIRKALKAGGITISQKSGTRNLTSLGDTDYAPRFSVDITFIGEDGIDTQTDLGTLNELWDKFTIVGEWAPGVPVTIKSS